LIAEQDTRRHRLTLHIEGGEKRLLAFASGIEANFSADAKLASVVGVVCRILTQSGNALEAIDDVDIVLQQHVAAARSIAFATHAQHNVRQANVALDRPTQ